MGTWVWFQIRYLSMGWFRRNTPFLVRPVSHSAGAHRYAIHRYC